MLWDREAYNPWNRLQLQRDAYTWDPSATYYTRPFAKAWPSLFERERLLPFVAVVVVILPYLPASVRLAVHWELNSKSPCTKALRSKRQRKIMLNENTHNVIKKSAVSTPLPASPAEAASGRDDFDSQCQCTEAVPHKRAAIVLLKAKQNGVAKKIWHLARPSLAVLAWPETSGRKLIHFISTVLTKQRKE